jgi:signal transduction histidine kinase
LWLVLENVVSNAIQAMPDGGTTTVRTRLDDADGGCHVSIEVSDTGHGMDERVLERAMDPFFTTRPSGTGLGLSIVQRIMEAHGGQVNLRSKPGEGTTASLRLPVPSRAELQSPRPPIDSDA